MGTITGTGIAVDGVTMIELPTAFPVGPVNVYLIEADKLTLVDTGPDGEDTWRLLNQALAEHGYSIHDIEQIVLTHHHVDHVGMLQRILQVRPVPVYGHPSCRPWLRQEEAFRQRQRDFVLSFYRESGVPEDLWGYFPRFQAYIEKFIGKSDITAPLQDGEPVPGMPEWTVLETKGHAQSHIVLFRQRDGVLLAGDHIIQHISSNAVVEVPAEPGEERAKPLLQYRENLRKCADLPVSVALSGHGKPVTDVPALVDLRLAKMDERAAKIKRLLAAGATTAFEVARAMFPDKYEQELTLTLSEVVGHLDLLLARGEIVQERYGEIVHYRPV